MNCSNCAVYLADDLAFCTNCGLSTRMFGETPTVIAAAKRDKSSRASYFRSLGLVLFGATIAVSVFWFSEMSRTDRTENSTSIVNALDSTNRIVNAQSERVAPRSLPASRDAEKRISEKYVTEYRSTTDGTNTESRIIKPAPEQKKFKKSPNEPSDNIFSANMAPSQNRPLNANVMPTIRQPTARALCNDGHYSNWQYDRWAQCFWHAGVAKWFY